MDRFQAMQLFCRIVDLGSFTKAAEQLNISRASATELIKQLEGRLGVRLLQRTTRQVSTTIDGRSYYQHCLSVLGEIEAVENTLSQTAKHPRGRLKIDLPASLGRLVVIPALADFYAHYPDIVLEIGIGDRMVDLVHEGIDCVVRIGELSDSTLIARSLAFLPQVTCASPAYLAHYGLPSQLDALAGHRCVDYLSATTGRRQPLEFSVSGQIELHNLPASIAVNHGEAYVTACEAGLGIIQVPHYHVKSQLATGRLVELLPQHSPPALPMTALYPQHRQLTPRLRVFIEWLVALFSQAKLRHTAV